MMEIEIKKVKEHVCCNCEFYMDPCGCWMFGRKLSVEDMKTECKSWKPKEESNNGN